LFGEPSPKEIDAIQQKMLIDKLEKERKEKQREKRQSRSRRSSPGGTYDVTPIQVFQSYEEEKQQQNRSFAHETIVSLPPRSPRTPTKMLFSTP
jgi:hypothetical protein